MSNDLTKGTPWKKILVFALPYFLGIIFQQFYNMADTVIVGRTIGINALAAVGSTGSLSWFSLGAVQGLTMGFSAVTAQRFGAKDDTGVKKSFAMGILLSAVFSLILTFFCVNYSYEIMHILKTPQNIIDDAYRYIFWIFIALPISSLYNQLANAIRAIGDSKTPLLFLVIACIINIVLDFVCILYFKMGVAGAGVATFIAQIVSALLCLRHIKKHVPILRLGLQDFKIDFDMIRQITKIGMPMSFLNMVLSFGGIAVQFANNTLGTVYVAANTAAAKLEQFVVQPIVSFSSALTVYVAQNYGANKLNRIKKGVNQSIIICTIWSILSLVLVILLGKPLLRLIVGQGSEEIITNGFYYMVINSSLLIILSLTVICKSTIQAVGYTFLPMVSGVVEVFCRAGASLYLSKFFGYIGVCFSNPLAWFGGFVIVAFGYWILMRDFKRMGMNYQDDNDEE